MLLELPHYGSAPHENLHMCVHAYRYTISLNRFIPLYVHMYVISENKTEAVSSVSVWFKA